MPTFDFQLYRAADISFAGGITLSNAYNPANNVHLTITDNDNILEGDLNRNEDGNDTNQFGFATFANGSTLGGPTHTVYSELHYTLTHPVTGVQIRLYRIEMDSNPNSTSGSGNLVGYLPETPLEPGVTYSFFTSNTTPGNDRNYNTITGALCFDARTLIETEYGFIQAGSLCPGIRVKTLDGTFKPLRWVYSKRVSSQELIEKPNLRPILIDPDALGPDRPNLLTRLSPHHKVLVRSPLCELMFERPDVLIPIKALVNGQTIRIDESGHAVTYVHLLFDRHEIVFAHNLEAESLAPNAEALNELDPAAREELETLFPQFIRSVSAPEKPTVPLILTVHEGRALAA